MANSTNTIGALSPRPYAIIYDHNLLGNNVDNFQFVISKKNSGNFGEQEGMVAALEGVLVGEGPGAKREEARLVEPSVS